MIETSPMTKIVGLGLGATLLLSLMYLFTLNKVADTGATRAAKSIDTILAQNLDKARPTRVTMQRDGPGAAAPRIYVVRLHPASAGIEAKVALRLSVSARDIVLEEVAPNADGPVTVHCIVEDATPPAHHAWRRTGGEDGLRIEDLVPPPELPSADVETPR